MKFLKQLAPFLETNPTWDEWPSDLLIGITMLYGFTLIGFGVKIKRNFFMLRIVILNIAFGLWLDPEK